MRKFGPFDTSSFFEVENRRLQRAFNPGTGFVKSGQGAVTAGTGAQLVIAAYPDGALVDGLYVENPASETVTVTTNTASTNPRIDRLVMRLDMGAKTIAPFQIVGTPGASPQAPPLVQTATVFDMPLCQYRFPGSASAQNPGSIVDERVWISKAPVGIPTMADRPTTDVGQGSQVYDQSTGRIYTYDGTYWRNGLAGDAVPAGAPAGAYITGLRGSATPTPSAGLATVGVGHTFSAAIGRESVICSPGDTANNLGMVISNSGGTTSAFHALCRDFNGGLIGNGGSVRINWSVVGYND